MIYGVLCFAIFFSFVGTVLGGLWADDSWGRFWGWDPKENGALIIVHLERAGAARPLGRHGQRSRAGGAGDRRQHRRRLVGLRRQRTRRRPALLRLHARRRILAPMFVASQLALIVSARFRNASGAASAERAEQISPTVDRPDSAMGRPPTVVPTRQTLAGLRWRFASHSAAPLPH